MTNTLTAAQLKNLETLRAAGMLRRVKGTFQSTTTGAAVTGLHRPTIARLVKLGLVSESYEIAPSTMRGTRYYKAEQFHALVYAAV